MDFGEGIESTLNIESIWSTIKAKIKQTYIVIPNKNLFKFKREAEFKFLNKNKNFEEK